MQIDVVSGGIVASVFATLQWPYCDNNFGRRAGFSDSDDDSMFY